MYVLRMLLLMLLIHIYYIFSVLSLQLTEKTTTTQQVSHHRPIYFSFCLFGDRCGFFRVFFVPLPFSLRIESTSYVLSFRMVFFYLVTTGWIFDISLLFESSIKSVSMTIASSPQTVDCMNHKKKEYYIRRYRRPI